MPDENFLYDWMKIKDAIEFFKDFFSDFNEVKVKDILDLHDA